MSSRRDAVLLAKVKARILDADRHLNALRDAAAVFGGDFDADAFEAAWRSSDSLELHRAYAVQAGFENVVNTSVTVAIDLCRLERWWNGPTVPTSSHALGLLHENGVIDARTRSALKEAQEERSDIQHDYAGVAARAVHEQVIAVLDAAPLLLQGAADQLRSREGRAGGS